MINNDTIPVFDPKKPFKAVDSVPEFDPNKPFEEKKNPVQNESTNTSIQFGSGLNPFQSSQVDTKSPSVLSPKGKEEYQEQVKAFKPQEVAKEGQPKPPKRADGGGATAFMKGLNDFNSSVFNTPRLLYDAASSITDKALQALNLQQDESNYDDIVAASGYTSPLSVLDRLGDYYEGKSNQYAQRQEKFDKGIVDSFTSGEYANGGKQLWNNIAGSIPSMVGMAVTGGAGNIAKLKYAQKTLASALPFISGRNAELAEDESIPKPVRVVNATLNGLSEVIFDQSFGTQAMIGKVVDAFKNEGRDAAVKVAKDFTKGFATEAIKKIQPFTGTIKGAVEEMSTTLSQNLVDKYTINPDKDLMEGVLDAGLVGGTMTGGISALGTVAYSSSQKKQVGDLMKQREEIVGDLDNENLPDDVKEDLSDKLYKIDKSITKIDDDNESVVSQLSDEDKTVLKDKEAKIQSIEQALQDESLSETAKETLADRLLKEQDKVDEILTKEPDTEEQIIAEGQEAETEYKKTDDQVTYEQNIKELEDRASANPTIAEIAKESPNVTIVKPTPNEPVKVVEQTEAKTIEQGQKIIDAVFKSQVGKTKNGDISRVLLETLTIAEGNELYNTDQEYRELYDLDENGTMTEAQRERMTEIYRSHQIKKKVALIDRLYNKAIETGSNPELIEIVDKIRGSRSLPKSTKQVDKVKDKRPDTVTGSDKAVAEEVDQLSKFKDIIDKSKTLDEAFKKAQSIKGIPKEVSQQFNDTYNHKGELTPKQTFEKFYNETKSDKKEVVEPVSKPKETTIKSSFDSNIEALTNPETGLAATVSKLVERAKPFRDAYMERKGFTMQEYSKLSDIEKRKIDEDWRNSKEYKELDELREPKETPNVESKEDSDDKITGKKLFDRVRASIKPLPDMDLDDAEANANWTLAQKEKQRLLTDDKYLQEQIDAVIAKKKANQSVFEAMYGINYGSESAKENVPLTDKADNYKTTVKEPVTELKEEKEKWTESKDLNRIFSDAKKKYGEKDGSKYNDVVNRLVNPNENTIIEVRANGVVVKEDGKYLLKPFTNTDANYKKWQLARPLDVTDQYVTPKSEPKEEDLRDTESDGKSSTDDGKKSKGVQKEESLKDVESTAKALEGKDIENIVKPKNTKIVDENGQPIKLYHVSEDEIKGDIRTINNHVLSWHEKRPENEKALYQTDENGNYTEIGFHLGGEKTIKDFIDRYGITPKTKLSVFLDIKNPIKIKDLTAWTPTNIIKEIGNMGYDIGELKNKYTADEALDILNKLGIDGFKYENIHEYTGEKYSYMAIHPEQIKVIDNKSIAEDYHKAKAEGSNPELVKAVEDLLGAPSSPLSQAFDLIEQAKRTKKTEKGKMEAGELAVTNLGEVGKKAIFIDNNFKDIIAKLKEFKNEKGEPFIKIECP